MWLRSSADMPDQPRSSEETSSPAGPYFSTPYLHTAIGFSCEILTPHFLQPLTGYKRYEAV
jgi:hypothetical protein